MKASTRANMNSMCWYLPMLTLKPSDDSPFHRDIWQHRVSCFCLLLAQWLSSVMAKNTSSIWVSSLAFLTNMCDERSDANFLRWLRSRLVGYLIATLWQSNLSLWCCAMRRSTMFLSKAKCRDMCQLKQCSILIVQWFRAKILNLKLENWGFKDSLG